MSAPSTHIRPTPAETPDIDWSAIDWVLFDMDGTLLDLHYDNVFWLDYLPRQYAASQELPLDTALQRLMPMFAEHRGLLQWYCIDYWSERLELDVAALKPQLAHLIAWHPGAESLLEWLRSQGKQRWLTTNAHRASLGLKDRRLGLSERLDRLISAHDLGHPKESAGFWQVLADQHGVDLGRSLLVDDNLAALARARECGVAQTLAVSKPDSARDAIVVEGHPSVETLAELLPAN